MLKLSEMGIEGPMIDTGNLVNKTNGVKRAILLFVKQMLVSGQVTHILNSVSQNSMDNERESRQL